MVDYLGKFIKDMSQLTHNMRLLLMKIALFQWTASHEANFQKLKENMSSDTYLMYFWYFEANYFTGLMHSRLG